MNGRAPDRRKRGKPNRPAGGEAPAGTEQPAGLAARQVAARLLGAVVTARSPMDGLTDAEHGHPQYMALDARDRALVRAILMSALRHHNTIEALITKRLDRPLPENAHALSHVLHVGAAQIAFLDVPDSAAVNLAVAQAKADPRTRRFAGLVNAVLRSIGRGGARARDAALAQTVDAPAWFAERLARDYGAEKAVAILAAHRIEAPVDFTVKSDPEGWAERLGGFVLPTGSVRVESLPAAVPDLPGFSDGQWWVQDAAAALPARLLGEIAGKHVGDLCAAPGGKTAQLALAGARVTAIDLSASRLKRLEGNLARLGLAAETKVADLRTFVPDEPFDAVLLDAPCSSTGTVRRHPDVPWTKTTQDIERLAALQGELLQRAVAMVKPGGRVVFSNCSLDKDEGESLMARFTETCGDAVADPVRPEEIPGAGALVDARGWLRTTPADWQFSTPRQSGLDGFFAARLFRR